MKNHNRIDENFWAELNRGVDPDVLSDIGYSRAIGHIALGGETTYPSGLRFYPESQDEKHLALVGVGEEYNRVEKKPLGAKYRIRTVAYEAFDNANLSRLSIERFENNLNDDLNADDIREIDYILEQIARFKVLENMYSELKNEDKLYPYEKIRWETNRMLDSGFDYMPDSELITYYLRTKENILNRFNFWSNQLLNAKKHYIARDYIK